LIDHLAFRDALRSDSQLCDQYAALKIDLAERHRNDRAQYSESKTEFVRRVLSSTTPSAPPAQNAGYGE
jgi:GrpB-like predicted nucleotidyltransferase (UPF0157 family)